MKDSKGDLDGAMADYNRVIALKPKDPEAYKLRGDDKEKKHDFDGGIATDFDIAISLDDKSADAYMSRAVLKREKGDLDGAMADFGKAIDLCVSYAPRGQESSDAKGAPTGSSQWERQTLAYYSAVGLANIEQSKGELKSALADFSRAITFRPRAPDAYEKRAEVEKAMGDVDAAAADRKQAEALSAGVH